MTLNTFLCVCFYWRILGMPLFGVQGRQPGERYADEALWLPQVGHCEFGLHVGHEKSKLLQNFFWGENFCKKKLMITSKHEQWGRGGKSFLRLQTIKFLNSGGLMVESVLSEFTEYRYSWYSWPPESRVPRSLSPHYIQRKQRINRSKKVSDTTGSLSVQLLRSSCWQESSRSVWLRVSTTRCCTKHRNTKFKLYVRHRTVQRKEREKAC